MATTKRMPLINLGWQNWSFLAIVLAMVLGAAVWVMFG